jgi:hypothetical protein
MKAAPSFATLLQRFFTERLVQQRQASPHTISSYRDTFRLLLKFTRKRLRKPPDRIAFEISVSTGRCLHLNAHKEPGYPAHGRNIRLALDPLAFAAFEMPSRSANPTCAGHPHNDVRAGSASRRVGRLPLWRADPKRAGVASRTLTHRGTGARRSTRPRREMGFLIRIREIG